MSRRTCTAALAAVLVLSSCGTAGRGAGTAAVQPREGQSGLQLSGTVDGRHVAVNDGLPELIVGDCDPRDGVDSDVCAISRTIDGRLFVLSLENPGALTPGETLKVGEPPCRSPAACDAVSDVAIVDVQLDTGARMRATGGTLEIGALEDFQRYAGSLRLQLAGGGRLSGDLDLVPRPD